MRRGFWCRLLMGRGSKEAESCLNHHTSWYWASDQFFDAALSSGPPPFFFPWLTEGRTRKRLEDHCSFINASHLCGIIIAEEQKPGNLNPSTIFNSRASSKTPELFNFLWKTRKLNDPNCYSQGCPEELDQGPMGPHLCGYAEAKWPRYYQEFMDGLGVGENSGFQTAIPQAQLV